YRTAARLPLSPFPTRRSSDLLHIVGVRQCPLYRANMALNWIAPNTGTASAAEHKQGAISRQRSCFGASVVCELGLSPHSESVPRSEEHTSELQSRFDLVCRLL